MTVTAKMIEQLQTALQGASQSRVADDEAGRYHVGAIWYGDWLRDADEGRFGREEKPRHNACIARKNQTRTRFTLHPITSERKSGAGALRLPRGMIPGGEFTASWLLPRYRLLAFRATLNDRFTYKCNLPADYVRRMKEMVSR